MEKRELIQKQAVRSIIDRDYTGAYVIAPRVGKSKIVTDAIGDKFFSPGYGGWGGAEGIYIACPRQTIADIWHYEIAKWGGIHCDATVLCFPSLKKVPKEVELLVIDEWHKLSPNQMDMIIKISPKRLLMVTGTANDYSRGMLMYKLKMEVVFEYSIGQAIQDDIISNFHVHVVKVPLDDLHARHNVQKQACTERQAYNYYTALFDDFRMQAKSNPKMIKIKDSIARKRAELIYRFKSKLEVAKKIIDSINDRMLIFTTRTAIADKLAPYSYHSKNKKEGNLERFLAEEINTLAVVNMTDMGITFPSLKLELVHQLQSNSEDSLQKFLRTCNLEDGDKEAKIIVTVCKDTMDEAWVTEAMVGVPKEKITWYELDELEELLEQFR